VYDVVSETSTRNCLPTIKMCCLLYVNTRLVRSSGVELGAIAVKPSAGQI